jgi:tetratricopeptide (TPR) repeat protein
MNIYKDILGQSGTINPVDVRWPYPIRNDIYPLLCTNIEMIEDKDLAIMLLRGKKSCLLLGYNLTSGKTKWEEFIDDQFVADPVIINNTIFLTSNRVKEKQVGQPTLYAYNISDGREIFIREFQRENDNQAVLLSIEERYSNISDDNSTILLEINKFDPSAGNSRDVALIEITSNTLLWKIPVEGGWGHTVDFIFLNTERADLLLLILRHNIIALNYKTGIEAWRENFTSYSRLLIWNQMILEINVEEDYLALWDPVSQKEVWKASSEGERVPYIDLSNPNEILEEFRRRLNKDFLILNYTNGDLVALNFDGGIFNWNRMRWTQNIGLAQKIWLPENSSNRAFCLTKDDTLFTINTADGEIINRFPTDRHDYTMYYDDSQNAMVLSSADFLIGIDPLNGDQLWKVKDRSVDQTRLIDNSVLAVKTVQEDSLIIINNYNRDNGNLVWGTNINVAKSLNSFNMLPPICGGSICDFCSDFTTYIEPYSDDSLVIVLHDEIIKMGAIQSKSHAVRQKDVHLQIARTHDKNGQLNQAISAYESLIEMDQMNQEAYLEIANIYQKKKEPAKAVESLINYYELVLPTSTAGIKTIQELKKLSNLNWKKDIYWAGFNQSEMKIDNEKLFLFLDNNVESYSIQSSALIWKSSLGDENTSVVSTDVKSEKDIFFITKHTPDVNTFYLKERLSGKRLDFEAFKKASKYSLVAMSKRDGDKIWDIPLDITGESNVLWMGVNSNKIIIQSMLQNNMSISAYDISGKHFLWEASFVVSPLYTTYVLTPVFYKGDLLLPLDDRIEYINTEDGISGGIYTNEDVDQIFLFNENSIQDNTMNFFINEYVYEYDYIVVDLDNNLKISEGSLDLENPKRGLWINNIFVDVSSSGIVTVYDSPLAGQNEPTILWKKNYNVSMKLLEADKQNTYLLDKDNNCVYQVNTRSGKKIKKTRLLWPGQSVEIRSHYFIVQSKNKLYVFPI